MSWTMLMSECISCYFIFALISKQRHGFTTSNRQNREQNVYVNVNVTLAISNDLHKIERSISNWAWHKWVRDKTWKFLSDMGLPVMKHIVTCHNVLRHEVVRPLTISTWFPQWMSGKFECLIPESSYMTHQQHLFLGRNISVMDKPIWLRNLD